MARQSRRLATGGTLELSAGFGTVAEIASHGAGQREHDVDCSDLQSEAAGDPPVRLFSMRATSWHVADAAI
jgi:hypothetical protein